MLAPIYQLLFQEDRNSFYLALTEDQISISYKTYMTDGLAAMQTLRV